MLSKKSLSIHSHLSFPLCYLLEALNFILMSRIYFELIFERRKFFVLIIFWKCRCSVLSFSLLKSLYLLLQMALDSFVRDPLALFLGSLSMPLKNLTVISSATQFWILELSVHLHFSCIRLLTLFTFILVFFSGVSLSVSTAEVAGILIDRVFNLLVKLGGSDILTILLSIDYFFP